MMKKMEESSKKQGKVFSRRDFLKNAGLATGAVVMLGGLSGVLAACGSKETGPTSSGAGTGATAGKTGKIVYLATSIRSLSNPYHVLWNKGAEKYVSTLGSGVVHQTLLNEGSSEKQLNDIKALIAKAGRDVVFNCDPNEAPDAAAIADVCEKAGVYFVTQWNKPDDLHPKDFKYYVCHMAGDGVAAGYDIAKVLFNSFKNPGKGKILALQGMLANTAAIDRFNGLKKALAEFPGVELIDQQAADWDSTKALNITQNWLVAHPQIDGIWAANDSMALGAVEALRAKGLAGKVPVVGHDATDQAIEAINKGEMVATVSMDPYWQGGFGLAIPYAAYKGIIDPTKEPPEHREFYIKYILITKDNVNSYINKYVKAIPNYDYSKLWDNIARPMK